MLRLYDDIELHQSKHLPSGHLMMFGGKMYANQEDVVVITDDSLRARIKRAFWHLRQAWREVFGRR